MKYLEDHAEVVGACNCIAKAIKEEKKQKMKCYVLHYLKYKNIIWRFLGNLLLTIHVPYSNAQI